MTTDLTARIMTKVVPTQNGCWTWVGSRFFKPTGSYGQLRMGGRPGRLERAHRLSYQVFIGRIPKGLVIDHLCGNTLCVNPDHLEAVTQEVNCQRRRDSGLSDCKHGHRYTRTNIYVRPDGKRECVTCRRIRRKDSQ